MQIQTKTCQVGTRLNSSTQKKDLKVVEYLIGKVVEKNTVAERISAEFCKALPSGH
jgi:hypothetical protein